MQRLIIFLLVFIPNLAFSQDLLVNGDFEDENTCTEYNATCAPEAWISTGKTLENYIKSIDWAYSGTHCYAIEAGHYKQTYQRSFVRSRLLCGLRGGNKYRLTFFIKSSHPILDSIGVYFTTDDILYEKRKLKDLRPTYYLAHQNKFDPKDTGWQKVAIDFIAKGTEVFITIGNFSRRDITGPTGIRLVSQYLVYLDDFTLVPLNPKEQICNDWINRKQEIYDQNERHQFMERLVRMQRYNKIPGETLTTRTTIVTIDTLVLSDILFETGKSNLQSASFKMLDSLCNHSKGKQVDSIVIKGHTDNRGTVEKNEKLSLDRANAVAAYLKQCLFGRIQAYGFSDRFPIADNKLPDGRQRNRRVEILIYIRE